MEYALPFESTRRSLRIASSRSRNCFLFARCLTVFARTLSVSPNVSVAFGGTATATLPRFSSPSLALRRNRAGLWQSRLHTCSHPFSPARTSSPCPSSSLNSPQPDTDTPRPTRHARIFTVVQGLEPTTKQLQGPAAVAHSLYHHCRVSLGLGRRWAKDDRYEGRRAWAQLSCRASDWC